MFKYFKDNQQKQVNYKLFIYLNDDNLPDKTVERITDILKIKEARKILSTTDIELTLAEIDSLSTYILYRPYKMRRMIVIIIHNT